MVCLAALLGTARPLSASEISSADFLRLADRLLDEVQRQHNVNQRMAATVGDLTMLIDDLTSNDLLREGKGDELKRIVTVLGVLNVRHVPNAAQYLEAARARLEALKPNLDKADTEIALILKQIESMINKADKFQQADDLLSELRVIIRKQDTAIAETATWFKALLADTAADSRKDELAGRQSDLARDVARFRTHLKESADAAGDPDSKARLDRANTAMNGMKTEQTMTSAAREIGAKKAMTAAGLQKNALADLREIEKLLQADSLALQNAELKAAKEDLEKLLKDQQDLRAKTEKAPLDKPEPRKDLVTQQRDLENRTDKAKQPPEANKPDPNKPEPNKDDKSPLPPEAKKALDDAKTDMKNAEEKIADANKENATDNQHKAEEDLSKAIASIDQKIADNEKEMAKNEPKDPSQEQKDPTAQKLEALAEKQDKLRNDTAKSDDKDVANMEKPQHELGDEMQQAKTDDPDINNELEKAKQESDKAQEDLKNDHKSEAMKHQAEASKELHKAAEKAEELAKKNEHDAAEAEKLADEQKDIHDQTEKDSDPKHEEGHESELAKKIGELEKSAHKGHEDLETAKHEADHASEELSKGEKESAMESQKKVMAALKKASKSLQPHLAKDNKVDDPKEGERKFVKTDPRTGMPMAESDTKWNPMSPREREQLYQKYQRQLPLEYRELLEDYYEALSK
jgi:hypothetical protein